MSLNMYTPLEYDESRAGAAVSKINQGYESKDRAGKGNCRRCDHKGFLNQRGFCSVDCENGQVALPYQK